MGNLAACPDVVIWAIDLKKGMELGPWAACIGRLATTPEQARALLADAVAILEARAALLAARGQRVWEPSPDMPALIILIDEYAELADDAPGAVRHADSVARRGRAVAVNLIAATQRPTQKAMGQGAVRSQMDVRICFRVRERKDVDLILGQGMLAAGWNAHALNAPGKFLIAAAEHDTPRRARAYLLTDESVAGTASRYAACGHRWMRYRSRRLTRHGPRNRPKRPNRTARRKTTRPAAAARHPARRPCCGPRYAWPRRTGFRFPASCARQAWAAAGSTTGSRPWPQPGAPPRSPGDNGVPPRAAVTMSSAGRSCTRLCTCTASRVSARKGAHGYRARARAQLTQRDGRAPAERP